MDTMHIALEKVSLARLVQSFSCLEDPPERREAFISAIANLAAFVFSNTSPEYRVGPVHRSQPLSLLRESGGSDLCGNVRRWVVCATVCYHEDQQLAGRPCTCLGRSGDMAIAATLDFQGG